MERRKNIATIILFFALIGLPYLLWPMGEQFLDTQENENRTLAEIPTLTLAEISYFPSRMEKYIDDHLPFRNEMIQSYNLIRYTLGETFNGVIKGKDGWLFYTGNDLVDHYKGRNLLTEEQLIQIADNLVRSRDKFAEEGREFVIFIAPNKNRIYADYMPDYYGEPAEMYQGQQIVEYLRKNTDLRVIFPVEELEKAVNNSGEELLFYYKTDTHWNPMGAYIGASALLKELGIEMPMYDEIEIKAEEFVGGDLANMLNLSSKIDAGMKYEPKTHERSEVEIERRDPIVAYHNLAHGLDQRKIMIYRDSFATNMLPTINSQFSENRILHFVDYTSEMVRQEDPDIFVLEAVERYAAGNLLSFIYE